MTSREAHELAMSLADEADALLRAGDKPGAAAVLLRAAAHEEQALLLSKAGLSQAILTRSTAWLLVHAYDAAPDPAHITKARELISAQMKRSDIIAGDLRAVLTACDRRHP